MPLILFLLPAAFVVKFFCCWPRRPRVGVYGDWPPAI